MAQLTIDIPNGQLTRVLDGFALAHGYTGTFNGSAETKQAFLKRRLIAFVKEGVQMSEQAASNEATRQSVESGVTLT